MNLYFLDKKLFFRDYFYIYLLTKLITILWQTIHIQRSNHQKLL